MARHPKHSTPKLTPKLIDDLATAIRGGCYVETAVALCGISKDTFYRWLRLADSVGPDSTYGKLSDAVKKGLAEAEARDIAVIDSAAQSGQWQAAAWRLERKFPDKWGRQARLQVEHLGSADSARIIDVTKLSNSELLLLEKALAPNEKDSTESEN